jgi:hypothetical protein
MSGFLNLLGFLCVIATPLSGQNSVQESLEKRVEQLTEAVTRVQAQLEDSQRQLKELSDQLSILRQRMAVAADNSASSSDAAQLAKAVDEIRERQAIQESQIATHDQDKVESESKYPVKLSGLILLNGFVNTRQVDVAAMPSIAIQGPGSTGISIRQTILDLDARGPHLFGASSHADVRVDFDGGAQPGGTTGAYADYFVRLRTAHAALDWEHTGIFFSYDRPLVSPYTPDSLTAVALPALAWSGNLWTWNPQIGLTHDFSHSTGQRLRLQAALIDVSDPPPLYYNPSAAPPGIASPPSTAENSRWPGVETRVALLGTQEEHSAQLGAGGYFAPHRTLGGINFDSWAGTLDYRQPILGRMELTGSFYRGQALGGLGGGGYKDFAYRVDPLNPSEIYFRAFEDVGGWAQWQIHPNERLRFNAAFGIDNVLASQVAPYAGPSTAIYQNLTRNRTFTGNMIYSPSAYLLFSLEYRHLASSPVVGQTASGNIIGIAAGYKF